MSIFDSFKKSHTANTLMYNNLLRESSSKEFDLNIEKILENWEVYHAVREIIANALDEQILTNTKDISICKTNDGCWHILDYGRGLNYHHLTQNENEEKLNSSNLIGRFGVGLKDALATLYRHGIKIKIISKYGCITSHEPPALLVVCCWPYGADVTLYIAGRGLSAIPPSTAIYFLPFGTCFELPTV